MLQSLGWVALAVCCLLFAWGLERYIARKYWYLAKRRSDGSSTEHVPLR